MSGNWKKVYKAQRNSILKRQPHGYQCPNCFSSFSTDAAYREHWRKEHGGKR